MSTALGQLVARIIRPIRYINMGTKWSLEKKYEGEDR